MSDPYRVRNYRPGDFAAVEEIWRAAGMSTPRRGDTESVVARTLAMGGRLLILEEDGRPETVGACWLTGDGRRLYLHHFAIRPDRQGRGLGKLLLGEALRVCRELGLPVKLEVHRGNAPAIGLYEQAGFLRLGDYEVYIIRDYADLPEPAAEPKPAR
jgi:ribosomal protein S18 acetylase RimI-like enzyme